MFDGTIEHSARGGAELSVLKFKSYVFNLDQFAGPRATPLRATSERYLSELLWPENAAKLSSHLRDAWMAEAHNRITAPLYCLAFALIALAAVTRGRRARGVQALRLVSASVAVAALRVAGYGLQGIATNYPTLNVFFYVIPVVGAVVAILVFSDFDLATIRSRFNLTAVEPA